MFTLCTHIVYIPPFLCHGNMFLIFEQTHTHLSHTFRINTSTRMLCVVAQGMISGVCHCFVLAADVNAGDACLKIRVPVTTESLTTQRPDLNPSLSIIIHIHMREQLLFTGWLIIATLETVYLVRRPITLPNICSSLHG